MTHYACEKSDHVTFDDRTPAASICANRVTPSASALAGTARTTPFAADGTAVSGCGMEVVPDAVLDPSCPSLSSASEEQDEVPDIPPTFLDPRCRCRFELCDLLTWQEGDPPLACDKCGPDSEPYCMEIGI